MTTSIRAQTVAATVDLLYLEVLADHTPDDRRRANTLGDVIVSNVYYHYERHPHIAWISRWLD